jgi:superfamily II DNA or RNA helicase
VTAVLEELNDFSATAGIRWFDYQWDALVGMASQPAPLRALLHFKTGAGKSFTALGAVRQAGHTQAVVIAPPSTHSQWRQAAAKFGVTVDPMSHAKFRMKNTKLSRTEAIIADEFHLLGGHKGQGWKKMDTLARHLQAPLIIASATPNYNDAERVYCIQHVLDPFSCRGGYLEFLYQHCLTEANPFAQEPKVLGFRNFSGDDAAAQYLATLPGVYYLPDDLAYQIMDIPVLSMWPTEAEKYGLNRRADRLFASQIEERHARVSLALVDDYGMIREHIYEILSDLVGAATTPSLVFAAHSTVALALSASLHKNRVNHAVVTGDTSAKKKAEALDAFRAGKVHVLVGTASLATGTDGLDKVCDQLIILDDTDDDSLRRQLVGRIMPRGEGGDASCKQVHRLVLT